jgi:hypothetical protein
MLIAIKSLDTFLKDIVGFDTFEVGDESNSTGVSFSQVNMRACWNLVSNMFD